MATRYTKLGLLAAGALVLYHVFSFIRTFLLRRQFGRRHGCQPIAKSATKDPFLGVDELRAGFRAMREHRILDEGVRRFRIYGNTHFAKELFNGFIATIEPENIKAILSLNFHDYGIGHRLAAFGPLLGAGIFDTDGEHWAASRALVRPNFNRDQVADLAAFEDLIQDLFKLLPRDGSVVDLQPLFFRYTIDSATEFLFGKSVGTLKTQQSGQDFAKAFDDSQAAVLNRMIMGPLAYIWPGRKARQSDRLCREFAQQFVDEALQAVESGKGAREAREKQKYIFSHELAWRTPDKTRILDELMNILLAGRDTTASLLSNLFFMLAKNPSVWDKIRREVADVLDGRLPTYENLRQLKYVQCCLNECKQRAGPACQGLSLTSKPFVFIPWCPKTRARHCKTPSFPSAAAKTGSHRFSCQRACMSLTMSTPCIGARISTDQTQTIFALSAGKTASCGHAGNTCRLTGARASASGSGMR